MSFTPSLILTCYAMLVDIPGRPAIFLRKKGEIGLGKREGGGRGRSEGVNCV